MRLVNFCYNPTSWNDAEDAPWPGGMADALVQPILPHMRVPYAISPQPVERAVNVYYAHRRKYVPTKVRAEVAVFVSHGIADKAWRNGPRVARQFDLIFTSGPAWSEKGMNEGIPPHKIIEVGYAKLDPLFRDARRPPRTDRRIRVVWAPTHGGGSERNFGTTDRSTGGTARYSSHHHADAILPLLPADRFDVVVARHPRHRPDHRSTLEEYVGADVVIADGGSTIYEAWSLGIPVVFPRWVVDSQERGMHPTFERDIYRRRIGRHVDDAADLTGALQDAATNGITADEAAFVEQVFPTRYRGISGRLHAEALMDAARGLPQRHAAKFRDVWFTSPEDPDRIVKTFVGSSVDRRLSVMTDRWVRELR